MIYTSTVIYAYFFYYNDVQYFVVVGLLGVCIGGTQSLTKSLLAQNIPKGFDVTYFSLLALTGGATSWIGPLITAQLNDHYGSYR
jgi:MFS-type transporter involved in bile tolerance (Atg22 family)